MQWQKLQRAWLRGTELATPHGRSLDSRELKCGVAAFSPGTSCKLLFIPSFLIESGSEMFRQDIIYVSIFQRHFIVWEREGGKRKSQYKNKSNKMDFFPPKIKNCLLLFISLLSFQLYYVIKVPFPTQYFSNDLNPGESCWCLAVMKYILAFEKPFQHAGVVSISLKLREIFCSISPK